MSSQPNDKYRKFGTTTLLSGILAILEEWFGRITGGDSSNVVIYDADGNPIHSHEAGDGGYHLGVDASIAGEQNPERHAWITALGDQMMSPRYRLVGHSFSGTTKDPNFWKEGVANGGTVTQTSGVIELETNLAANGSAQYNSLHRARFVAGSPQIFTGAVDWETEPTSDNVRRVGPYDNNNGFFFELNEDVFSVGSRKTAVDTLVSSGDFNGNLGATWTPTPATPYKIDIEFLPIGVFWYINGTLLHKINAAHLSDWLSLPIRIENVNSNAQDADVLFHSAGLVIMREGPLETESIYYHLAGNAATHILKYGAGTLHKIVFNNTSGTSITIYDEVVGAGTIIGVITTTSSIIGSQIYDVPFSVGLTLVTVGNSLDATIVYE